MNAEVPTDCVQVVNFRYVTNGPRVTGEIEDAALALCAPLLEMGSFLGDYEVHPHDYIDERLVSSADIHLSGS